MLKDQQRITIVDDDYKLAQLMKDALLDEGYQVTVFYDGVPFLRHVREHGLPHLALIDLHLPGIHGFDVSKNLKTMGDVPIVFVSNERDVETVIDGLGRFADDYLIKPFDLREMVVRVRRILSRIASTDYVHAPVTAIDDELAIDFANNSFTLGSKTITLTPIEASLLYLLVQNAGTIVPSAKLTARVWPSEEVPDETLRVHMHRLRHKLEPNPRQPRYIQTERGVGYGFIREIRSDRGEGGRNSCRVFSLPKMKSIFCC
jgi:DNA-binding response OmpR family regulator